ncbi:MAG TPA: c-type cytochrome [Actinobacteria bacterium]|nr:c-type cytochrome [Actinomycetota bacterium]
MVEQQDQGSELSKGGWIALGAFAGVAATVAVGLIALAVGVGPSGDVGADATPTSTTVVATTSAATSTPVASGGGVALDGDAANGEAIYSASCAACHAAGAVGVPGLGLPLVGSEFVNALADSDLVEFIKVGRDPSDPANTTGVGMPPKGGNPSLDDADLADVVAYIRSLNS